MSTALAPANQTAPTGYINASKLLAEKLNIDPATMMKVIKAQCFTGTPANQVTDEMLAVYINVAKQLQQQAPKFNPLSPGMLYAYPTRNGGIQPIIGPDGIYCLLKSLPDYEGFDYDYERDERGHIIAITAAIYMKGFRPFKKRCLLSEWKVSSNPKWAAQPEHMLEIRALKQAARMVIHGLPSDREEVEVIEAESVFPARVETRRDGFARLLPAPVAEPVQEPQEEAPAEPQQRKRGARRNDPAPVLDDRDVIAEQAAELPMSFDGDNDQ